MSSEAELLLQGGTLVDVVDGGLRAADIALVGGRIGAILPPGSPLQARRTLDCTGLLVSPGFVDIHTHSDLSRLVYEGQESRITQGITTEIVGNCGMTPAPLVGTAERTREVIGPVDVVDAGRWEWTDARSWLDTLERSPGATHVGALIGHGTLRAAVAHDASATSVDRRDLIGAVRRALDAGCLGVSLGLMYAPGQAADPEELRAVAEAVRTADALLAVHLRSYSEGGVFDAVDEALGLAESTGVRLQLSHLRMIGDDVGRYDDVLARIETARRSLDVAADAYPYLSGHTTLVQLLPSAMRAAGERACAVLPVAKIAEGLERSGFAPDAITVMKARATPEAVGRRPDPGDPWSWLAGLLKENDGAVDVAVVGSTEANLETAMRTPWISIASDGAALASTHTESAAHPRSWGTFPRAYRLMRTVGLTPAQALRRCTHDPAMRVGSRAVIEEGARADLVVFDEAALRDHATDAAPAAPATGIAHVVVGGQPVIEHAVQTAARPGRMIRRRSAGGR
ncbi:amidohydrolase family protein [Microbacterium sp. NPDC087591]|uniref:N-acyl-D-amino-acid deacylase family protein n=1 Tax=Microbacterium sp. NPDC087591 TaxID=3364192 RepID=UPI0037F5D772